MNVQNQIPESWQTVKLGEVALLNPTVSLNQGEDYPHIPMETLDWNSKYAKPKENKSFKGGAKFEEGDVLFARITPCLENGKIGIAKGLKEGKGFGSTEYFVIRGKKNITDTDFLYYLARSYRLRQTAINSMLGTSGRQRASIDALQSFEMRLPPIETQKRIASTLSALDDKIEVNNKIADTLNQMAQAIFKEWFVDFKFPGHKKAKFVDSELGKIPEGWKVKRIKDLGKVVTGKTPSTKDSENFGSKYPFITIPDMSNTFVLIPERYLSESGIQNMRNLLLPAGSICVSCIATVGLVSITTEESVTNQQINSIIPFKKEYKYFLYQFFRKSGRMLKAYGAGGSTTLIVNKSEFEQIKILLADWPTLGNYHKQVAPLYRKILLIIQENQKLAKMRDLLLPKLMRGEIRV